MKYFYLVTSAVAIILMGAGCRAAQPQSQSMVNTVKPTLEVPASVLIEKNLSEQRYELERQVADGQFDPKDFNVDPATTTFAFIDFKNGFKAELPYNPNWEISNIVPTKYEVFETGVKFGPLLFISPQGEGFFIRPYSLEKIAKRSAVEIEKELAEKNKDMDTITAWEKLLVNGKTIYHYTGGQVCSAESYELIGEKNNFLLSGDCGASGQTKELFLQVLDTVKPLSSEDKTITAKNVGDFSEQFCGGGFSSVDPDATVEYTNKSKGISLLVPYNSEWKHDDFILAPYFEFDLGLSFGKWGRSPESGCDGTGRQFDLSFRDLMTKEQVLSEAKQNAREGFNISSKEYTINDLRVLEVTESEKRPPEPDEVYGYGCSKYRTLYVFGKKYAYEFTAWFDCTDKSFEGLKKIISTVKLSEPQRVLVTFDYSLKNQEQLCLEKFNTDKSNTTVKYSNQAAGFEAQFPYNEKWGNNKYMVPPYEDPAGKDMIALGPIFTGPMEGGCGAGRYMYIRKVPVKSATEVVKAVVQEKEKTKIMKFNGLEVVKRDNSGLCSNDWEYEVIGKKYNYVVSRVCGSEEDFATIEQMLKTFTLIN